MKRGELRRFHDDAFFANEKHLNGKVFMIVEITPNNEHPSVPHTTILVDGVLDDELVLPYSRRQLGSGR
jgi:hypothetical protein